MKPFTASKDVISDAMEALKGQEYGRGMSSALSALKVRFVEEGPRRTLEALTAPRMLKVGSTGFQRLVEEWIMSNVDD